MSYGDTWGESAENLAGVAWYPTREAARVFTEMASKDFSVVEQRREALSLLTGLPSEAPFDYDRRFPARATYICSALGDWPNKLAQLRSALNYRDDVKSSSTSVDQQRLTTRTDQPNGARRAAYSGDDALFSFHQALRNCMQEIGRSDHVFGRKSFESRMGLVYG
jgi:hypothetical protein